MKKIIATICIALGLIACAGSVSISSAAEETQAASAAPAASGTAFTLVMLGTRHYADADVLRRNIAKIPSMQRFTQTVSSQKHLQFIGLFSGDEASLIADIEGLAADRFEVQKRQDKAQGLVITLRKIQSDAQ